MCVCVCVCVCLFENVSNIAFTGCYRSKINLHGDQRSFPLLNVQNRKKFDAGMKKNIFYCSFISLRLNYDFNNHQTLTRFDCLSLPSTGWIETYGVNLENGLEPGETCLCVSPGPSLVSRFTLSVPIHRGMFYYDC